MENFRTTATLNKKRDFYQHFGIRSVLCSLYGDKPEDIVVVEFKISENQEVPQPNAPALNADYWGWYDNNTKKFSMIYAQHFLLEMCFPYGTKASEEFGKGKAYRLEIVNIFKQPKE